MNFNFPEKVVFLILIRQVSVSTQTIGINYFIDIMRRVKKGKQKSKRRKTRKSQVSAGSNRRKNTHPGTKKNKAGDRKRRGTRRRKVRSQKGGDDFLIHLLGGLSAGLTAGLQAQAQDNRKKWLEKNKKQN